MGKGGVEEDKDSRGEKEAAVAGAEADFPQKNVPTGRKCATTSQELDFGGRIPRPGPNSAIKI